jgi:hypothetical protein
MGLERQLAAKSRVGGYVANVVDGKVQFWRCSFGGAVLEVQFWRRSSMDATVAVKERTRPPVKRGVL